MYYRFSLDDNIEVFKDLAQNGYISLFDQKYLGFLKRLHERFSTKIQLNVYYEMAGFTLASMPDKYKAEWVANSDWLRLSFHARADLPQRPYASASYDELKQDCLQVHDEICRFAGKKTLDYYTTLHWVEATKEGCLALKDCGIKGLVGLFGTAEKVECSYSLPRLVCEHMLTNSFYFDQQTDLWYIRNDIVINNYSLEELAKALEKIGHQEFCEIMIHEQYYLPHSDFYQADFEQKVEAAVKWLTNQGYHPAFLDDILQFNS